MNRSRRPWQSMALTAAAVAAAGLLGYHAEHQRLSYRQSDGVTRLSSALRSASDVVAECIQNAVRAPRWAETCDTLYYLCPIAIPVRKAEQPDPSAPVWLVQVASTAVSRLWRDPRCEGRGYRVLNGTTVAIETATRPQLLWRLEQHALYVDKRKGGLWVRRDRQEPELVALSVDQFRVEPDPASGSGFSLGLSAAWQVTEGTAIRRSVYRYVTSEERWEG